MTSLPRILICAEIAWAQDDIPRLFDGIAQVIHLDSATRADFLAGLAPKGKYAGIVGLYRHNNSTPFIGVFDEEIVGALAPSVKWIAHNGAGYDQIDVAACKKKGIMVSNTPGVVNDATATTALHLLLSTVRQYSPSERYLRALAWKPPALAGLSREPSRLTLAILGLGGIGLRFAEFAHALPMKRILYHSRRRVPHAPDWCEYVRDVESMLRQADVLSVHVPCNADTVGLVSERWIRTLKKGAIIINTARGKVIDEDAMIRALEDGHLSSVGLDVYPNEPHVNPKLLQFPHVTLLPHMGTESRDTQHEMEVQALANLRDFLVKGKGTDVVPEMK